MTPFYPDDAEAHEDWDSERAAFQRPADLDDQQLDLPFNPPERFWIDDEAGLPVVKDRLHDDMIIARFLTLAAATSYKDLRDIGVGHNLAWMANPEFRQKMEEEESA